MEPHALHHDDPRLRLQEAVHHLEHVLPGQAPIRDFVHHNTLHGYQHRPFPDALRAARLLTGARGYLPEERFRELYRAGRITRAELEESLRAQPGLEPDVVVAETAAGPLRRMEVLLAALLHPLGPATRSQLGWQIEEMRALERLQPDLETEARARLLAHGCEADVTRALWDACLETLGLAFDARHPEELLDLPEAPESTAGTEPPLFHQSAAETLDALIDRVGEDWTLRCLLLALAGEDVLDELRPHLIRHLSAHLDQGLAGWHNPERSKGFYAAWKESAARDTGWLLNDVPEWRLFSERLPDDALETVIQELTLLGLPEERWTVYLERLALELPGWSGMCLWRSLHPGYADAGGVPVDMMDYLAVRLILERLFAQRLCRRLWRVEASLSMLRWYFRHHPAELLVRHALYNTRLPEYLVTACQRSVQDAGQQHDESDDRNWEYPLRLLDHWRHHGPAPVEEDSAAGTAWPLFLLAQHLGLGGEELRRLRQEGARELLALTRRLDADETGFVWLTAYERHYRDQIFAALAENHGRGPWASRGTRPEAQLVFCMDDREEGMRRHLEEINPAVETLGAAAHFGVFMNWLGLDDERPTPLCPVVARPAHAVRERPRAEAEAALETHRRRRARRLAWTERVHQGTRAGLLSAAALVAAAAPGAALALAGRLLAPSRLGRLRETARAAFDTVLPTRIAFTAPDDGTPATVDAPRAGYTDTEQADRVQNFLRNIGLTDGFAPLVVIVGHGSNSENNPHMAAYDCGACSGRHSGPNARLFAAMANRPEVRRLLAERGVAIPADTWFLGAEHNTCDDTLTWYDLEDLPPTLTAPLAALRGQLAQAARAHAQERCRRFASAPDAPDARAAWRHIADRRHDLSQPRPELGHATNACAFIGRRAMSRGAFFDRRAFLISYDPTRDPEGKVLEGLLLANGPVGAGINLEYYFSTVNNEQYGCGTKAVHNVAGFLGVMEGAASDLRTGLPRQMIEIHEAMRLLVVVEAKLDLVTAIYQRQPPLQELIGGGWLLVAAKDPDSPAIHSFDPARGWVPWQDPGVALPTVARSADWYTGQREPLPPALITRATEGSV